VSEPYDFTHYIGDDCPPDGHVDEMLDYLRGSLSYHAYLSLFSAPFLEATQETLL